jgi:hypothetical protein
MTYKGNFSSETPLYSWDPMHVIDPNEVWKILEEQVRIGLYSGAIAILLEFQVMVCTKKIEWRYFSYEIWPTDRSACDENIPATFSKSHISGKKHSVH